MVGSLANSMALIYYGCVCAYAWFATLVDMQRVWLGAWARRQAVRMSVIVGGCVACAFGFTEMVNRPDGRVHVDLTGSSALVTTASGARILLLGRGDVAKLLTRPLQLRPARIDVLIVSTLDAETLVRGEAMLRDHDVGAIWLPTPAVITDTVYVGWRALAESNAVSLDSTRRAALPIDADLTAHAETIGADYLGNTVLGLRATRGAVSLCLSPERTMTPRVKSWQAGCQLVFVADAAQSPEETRYVVVASARGSSRNSHDDRRVFSLDTERMLRFSANYERIIINR
jgi:hypothetical protein